MDSMRNRVRLGIILLGEPKGVMMRGDLFLVELEILSDQLTTAPNKLLDFLGTNKPAIQFMRGSLVILHDGSDGAANTLSRGLGNTQRLEFGQRQRGKIHLLITFLARDRP